MKRRFFKCKSFPNKDSLRIKEKKKKKVRKVRELLLGNFLTNKASCEGSEVASPRPQDGF